MGFWATEVTPRLVAVGRQDGKIRDLRVAPVRACAARSSSSASAAGTTSASTRRGHPHHRGRALRRRVELGAAARGSPSHRPRRPRRPVAEPPRRECRRRPLDVHPLHDPRRPPRTRRGPARPASRRRPALPRARHCARRGCPPLAAPHRAVQKRVFDGCHLTRPIDHLVEESGLVLETIDRAYGPMPRCHAPVGLRLPRPSPQGREPPVSRRRATVERRYVGSHVRARGCASDLVAAVTAALAEHADPERAAGQQRYMKSALPYFGLTSPAARRRVAPTSS